MIKRVVLSSLIVIALISSGCANDRPIYKGLEPVYPKPALDDISLGHEDDVAEVDSLTPILRWLPAKEDGVTYDLVIYKAIPTGDPDLIMEYHYERGKRLYYREGLNSTSYAIKKPLEPDSLYYWSVRSRIGGKVSPWSVWDRKSKIPCSLWGGDPYGDGENMWWLFQTP